MVDTMMRAVLLHHILAAICFGVCATQASVSIGEHEIHAFHHQSSHIIEATNIQSQDVSQLPHKQTGHDNKEDVEASRHRQPQRNRLPIKDNKATAIDDTSTLDSGTRQNVPIVEDGGDRMLEIIEDEYLDSA